METKIEMIKKLGEEGLQVLKYWVHIEEENKKLKEELDSLKELCDSSIFARPIEDLKLSNRAVNCLQVAHCKTVGDITKLDLQRLLKLKSMGPRTAKEIEKTLAALGLRVHKCSQ